MLKKVKINNCTLYLGKCEDVLKNLKNESIDAVITDPPYFNVLSEKWDKQWGSIEDFQLFVKSISDDLYKILKNNGSLYWFGDAKNIAYCQLVLDKRFNLINNLVWKKINAMKKGTLSVNRSYQTISERILFYDKGIHIPSLASRKSSVETFKKIKKYMFYEREKVKRHFNFTTDAQFYRYINDITNSNGMFKHWFSNSQFEIASQANYIKMQASGFFKKEYSELRKEYDNYLRTWNNEINAVDVLEYSSEKSNKHHFCQKPLLLLQYLIERSTKENDIVLDCFMGGGSTGVACINTNRQFIGIECDEEYFNVAVKRIKKACEDKEASYERKSA